MAGRGQVLSLYKVMLREASKFPDFNFRSYFQRRIRDGFKESKSMSDRSKINAQIEVAQDNLQMIKRQATIGGLFDGIYQPLSIELAQQKK